MIPITISSFNIPNVPFFSQFSDIENHSWQKIGCGVASLAMLIDFYKPEAVTVNKLLLQGIASGAYDHDAGWIHTGLIQLAKKYDLDGKTYDFSKSSKAKALTQFKDILKDGPVMASIHYKFDPKSTIPHLVVIDGIENDTIFYNDPAAKVGKKQISTKDFIAGWKGRLIVIRPSKDLVRM